MYKHTQNSNLMKGMALASLIGAVVVGYIAKQFIVSCPLALLALGMYLGFRNLTVEVDDVSIRINFGIGWIKKEFRLEDISSVEAVRNCWMSGWGVRSIGDGWLYNVAGLDAVELKLKSGKRARIGTDEPQILASEIGQRLAGLR